MKRGLAIFLIALFTLSVSAENVEIDGICYNLITKGNIAEVTGSNYYSGDVVIPEAVTYNDVTYSVTTIRKNAFTGCSLNSIEIPSSITKICQEAFYNGGASSVKIKDLAAWCNINFESYFKTNPLSTASHLFLNDEEIHDLVIPDGVNTITDHAFYYFSGLTSVKIPSSVTSIGYECFAYCLGIKTVEIGDNASQEASTVLGRRIFYMCNNIDSVVLGNNIVEIGKDAFDGCKAIRSIVIPNSVKTIGSHAFLGCESLESVQLSENLKSIEWATFSSCTNLKSVIIPDGVEFLGETAFGYCTNLTEVKLPSNLKKIDWCVFQGCTSLTSIEIPDLTHTIYICAFDGCSNLKTVTLGKSVQNIQNGAFANCPALEEIYCKAKTPPTCYTAYNNLYAKTLDVFYDSYIEYVTLHVPSKSVETYKTTEPWSKFKTFVPINIPEHTLTYMVDGEVYKTYSIEEDEDIIAEQEPVKEGYTFSGWSEIPETMPAYDVTITGTFSINKYKLTYTVDGEEYKSYELDYGASIAPEEEPIKEGYSFSGWSEIPETIPAHDVTVTGIFTINKYQISYMVDNEVYKTDSLEYGATILPETALIKEGYSFSGWSEIPETMPAHDVTVTGTFTINRYNLTYIVDGEEYKSYELEFGASITPEKEPTKDGYSFSGWSEIPETMSAHDVTVTGSFIASQKCSTPVIRYENGQLSFTCDTEGAEFVTDITDTDVTQHNSATITLTATYNISVYAKAPNYAISDTVKATLCWIDAEPTKEGVIDGITNMHAKAVLIQCNGNVLSIQGVDLGTPISVFDVSGRKVGAAVVNSETTNVKTSLMKGQVGIVNINGKGIKVLIK